MNRRLWVGGVLLLLGLTCSVILYVGSQGRALDTDIQTVQQQLSQSQYAEALDRIEPLRQSHPHRQDLIRLRTIALAGMGDPRELEAAKEWWEQNPDKSALLALIQAAFRWDAQPLAQDALEKAGREEILEPVDFYALKAMVAARWGAYPDATRSLQHAMDLGYPFNTQSKLTLGILRIHEGNTQEGVSLLTEVAHSTEGIYQAEALRSLMYTFRQLNDHESIRSHAEAYFSHPRISVSDKIATLEFLESELSDAWMVAIMDWIWRSAPYGESVADLLIWAYQHERAVVWADEALASLPEVAFRVPALRLVAAARTRDLMHSQSHIDEEPFDAGVAFFSQLKVTPANQIKDPFAQLIRLQMLLETPAGMGTVQARVLERQIQGQLSNTPNLMHGMHRFARAFGLGSAWTHLLTQWVRENPDRIRQAGGILNELYREQNDTRGLYRLMVLLVEEQPENLLAINNRVLLAMLLDEDLRRVAPWAAKLEPHVDKDIRIASTYALYLLKKGRAEQGLDLVRMYPLAQRHDSSVALYYATLLKKVGDEDNARQLADSLQPATLLPEERRLLEELLR